MIVKYFADDGTEFESEEDCQFYENRLGHSKIPLMFDARENPITPEAIINGTESLAYVAYLLFRSLEEYENFRFWSDYYGYEAPEFGGEYAIYPKRFFWNDPSGYDGEWCDLDAEIKRLEEIKEFFEKGA
jgi:hypothetical protein